MAKRKFKQTGRDVLFNIFVKWFLSFATLITLYPFIYCVSMSISSQEAVLARQVWLWPKGFSLYSYYLVLNNPSVPIYYYNTLWYTIVGTSLSLFFTILGGYALSRKELFGGKTFMLLIVFTMYFGGGLIPLFLLVRNLGLYDTRWAIILPYLITTWYIILTRSYFISYPESLIESAKIDGYSEIAAFFKIVMPTSKPIIAVIALFYAVDKWNSYFPALIFLRNRDLKPIQIYLMNVLIQYNDSVMEMGSMSIIERTAYALRTRYALIMVTIIPIICVYPFIQRYFIKGVMIGSEKG